MAQITKFEAQAEIKSSADKFYGFFKNSMNSFVQMFPQILKSFEVQVTKAPDNGGSIVKWTFECEKANANAPDAKPYADLSIKVIKAIDSYLART
ncbi:hypothetical protein M0R45_016512 [Rubus argutus]|uniref:Bet v I/Major latex protein domain-containing protein n=1 Tax=Rubus argutus TaxID=59490 RepID=A0AAW1XTJ8_RUBAR